MMLCLYVTFISIFFNILQCEANAQELNFQFLQDDYIVNPERLELVNYNKNYLKHMKITTFKYNRTTTAFNISAIFRIDTAYEDIQLIFQAYKLASNEYRLFPIRFQTTFCYIYYQDLLGLKSFKGCRSDLKCPLQK
ncbi:hypothetical protein ILUMI_18993, partial [Ignelater luminosus]